MRDPVDEAIARLAKAVERTAAGSAMGLARSAAPVERPPQAQTVPPGAKERHVFHYKGAVATGFSDPYPPELPLRRAVLVCTTAGSGATTVTLYKNGVALSPTLSLAAAATRGTFATFNVAIDYSALDLITAQATTIGAGIQGLVCKTEYWA